MNAGIIAKLGIVDLNVNSFRSFMILLDECITSIGGDLYMPLMYYSSVKGDKTVATQYAEAFKTLRTLVFEFRTLVAGLKEPKLFLDSLDVIIRPNLKSCFDDLVFIMATMPDEDRWIGSCSVNKEFHGILKNTINDFYALDNLFNKLLEKKEEK